MRVGVIGVNHKLAGLHLRDPLAKACQKHFGVGVAAHEKKHHFVLLTTCNRTEVYFSSDQPSETHSYILNILTEEVEGAEENFDQKLYSYFGQECFHHLCRVTAGLDSAVIAETEIQGQVKGSYEQTATFALLPKELHYLFQKALKVGKQIRSQHPLGRGVPDLENAILNASNHFFGAASNKKILVVGASEIGRKLIAFLNNKGCNNIAITNRTAKKAYALGEKYHLEILPWGELAESWLYYDWIIFATKSPEFLVTEGDIPKKFEGSKLVFDLSVPRNVSPQIRRHHQITLMNIDQINRTLKFRKRQLNDLLGSVEGAIADATEIQMELFRQKESYRLVLKQTA